MRVLPRGLLLLALLIAGNLALIGGLRGRDYALLLLARDSDGTILSAAPDADRITRLGGLTLDYKVQVRSRVTIPVRTGGDSGLDDVRANIRWVRTLLSAGEDFHTDDWWLRDIVAAARAGGRRFLCDTYSRTLVNAFLRQGYAARVVLLDGHIAGEVYLPKLGQWVFADALYDFIASDAEGHPLSVLDASRRIRAGQAVIWKPVVGARSDDDDMNPRNRDRLEEMLGEGCFRVCDGEFGFGRLSKRDRVRDLLAGRVHAVEYVADGRPSSDRDERVMRGLLLVWNAGFVVLAITLLARRRPAPAAATAAPR